MKALIKENVFASGVPLSAGEVVNIGETDAKLLAAQGVATLDKDKIAEAEANAKSAAKKGKSAGAAAE